jgi:iron(III) transport system substrate-binding protein
MRPGVLRLSAGAAVMALTLAACGGDDGDTGEEVGGDAGAEDAAESSGEITLYSGRNEDLVQPVIDQFTAATGIEVNVRYGDTAQLAAQLVEEGERTQADVYLAQDGGALGALTKAGLLAELPGDVTDVVDPRFRAGDGTWVGTSGRARVIVYDSETLDEADVPASVYDLTEPEWQGRVGVAPGNASFEAFVTAMRVIDGDDAAQEWLDGMVANDVERFDNNRLILAAVEDGVVELGLINHYYWYAHVAELGLDSVASRLKFLPDDPGGLINVAGVGILGSTDEEAAALEFVRYLLGEEAQTYFSEETMEYPVLDGVPTAEDLPPMDSLNPPAIDLSDLDSLEETLRMLEEAGLT